jgi:hypothetical protein
MKALTIGLTWALGVLGCAAAPRDARAPTGDTSQMTASRIYEVAEQHVAAENYAAAVLLIRRALLQLPERADADALRHQLLLRLAYVQMLAYDQTGDRAFVDDAQRMLERYLVKHEELFGDGKKAKAQRDEVYEILYTVETLREAPKGEAPQGEATQAEPERASAPDEVAQREEEPEEVDTHAGEVLEDEFQRNVRVSPRGKLAQPDDPRVRERLRSTYADPEVGLVLTTPGLELVHGARPLVRGKRATSVDADDSREGEKLARRLGSELLVEARPVLRRCYEAAFARQSVAVIEGTVEASILPDGKVTRARIVQGGLVDALGDVCLIAGIETTRLAADDTRATTRVRLPLVFFYEGPVYFLEEHGMYVKAAIPGALPPVQKGRRGPMQPIHRFNRPFRPR